MRLAPEHAQQIVEAVGRAPRVVDALMAGAAQCDQKSHRVCAGTAVMHEKLLDGGANTAMPLIAREHPAAKTSEVFLAQTLPSVALRAVDVSIHDWAAAGAPENFLSKHSEIVTPRYLLFYCIICAVCVIINL